MLDRMPPGHTLFGRASVSTRLSEQGAPTSPPKLGLHTKLVLRVLHGRDSGGLPRVATEADLLGQLLVWPRARHGVTDKHAEARLEGRDLARLSRDVLQHHELANVYSFFSFSFSLHIFLVERRRGRTYVDQDTTADLCAEAIIELIPEQQGQLRDNSKV